MRVPNHASCVAGQSIGVVFRHLCMAARQKPSVRLQVAALLYHAGGCFQKARELLILLARYFRRKAPKYIESSGDQAYSRPFICLASLTGGSSAVPLY